MNAVLVAYRVKPEHLGRNRELAEGFLRELSAAQLENRYAVFMLPDDVSFIHLHLFADEADEKQFTQLPSFWTFEKDLNERCEEPPAVSKLGAVGSYGWLDALRHEPADLSRRNDWNPNLKTVIVRYKVKPEHAERNRELIRTVYSELELTQLADFNYATFVLDDGVSFVHLAAHGHETNPLRNLPAFQAFQEGIGERCAEQPALTELAPIGSYGWFNNSDRTALT
jgi:quinol monooxygenase YgiN